VGKFAAPKFRTFHSRAVICKQNQQQNYQPKRKIMNFFKKTVLPILLATIWISISEFVRNEFLLKSYWTEHYESMGLIFPSEPINGAFWGLWSLCFAIAIFIITKKFSILQTTFLSWFVGFVLMWIVVWNMDVLPSGLLVYAIPLSLFESYLASFIIKKLTI
jgi:hypothetical protein